MQNQKQRFCAVLGWFRQVEKRLLFPLLASYFCTKIPILRTLSAFPFGSGGRKGAEFLIFLEIH